MTTKDDLLAHCWMMFDYWMSRDYEGIGDEQFSRMQNGMWGIIQEIGRPSPPPLGVSVSDGVGTEDKFGG